MPLNERQKHSAELFAKGENITQIANECNVSSQTIYDDQKNKE
jgi:DNA-binding NarL/FixJ family response regulator